MELMCLAVDVVLLKCSSVKQNRGSAFEYLTQLWTMLLQDTRVSLDYLAKVCFFHTILTQFKHLFENFLLNEPLTLFVFRLDTDYFINCM